MSPFDNPGRSGPGWAPSAACMLGLLLAARMGWAQPLVSDLQVDQAISQTQYAYQAQPRVRIAFALSAPAEVTVQVSRHLPRCDGATRDRQGNLGVADRAAWRGRRYLPGWSPGLVFPRNVSDQASEPVDSYDVATDSQGHIYLMAPGGLFRYGPDGEP